MRSSVTQESRCLFTWKGAILGGLPFVDVVRMPHRNSFPDSEKNSPPSGSQAGQGSVIMDSTAKEQELQKNKKELGWF